MNRNWMLFSTSGILAILLLVLTACTAGAPVATTDASWLSTPQPRPTNPNPTLEATYQALDMAAAQTRTWVQQQALVGTIQAADTALAAEGTAVAFRAWQTQQVLEYTAEAGRITMTAQESERLVTQAARATADERAWIEKIWTVTADTANATGTAEANARATAFASTATQTFYNIQSTQDAANALALATSQAANAQIAAQAAEKDKLDLAAKQMTNEFMAWWKVVLPVLVAAVLLACGSFIYFEWKRNKTYQRDERGLAPVLLLDGQVVDPDRMLWPWLNPAQPMLPAAGVQARITENAQKVLALSQVQPGKHGQALRIMKPAPQGETLPETAGEAAQFSLPLAADWRLFVQHQGPEIPLGIAPDGSLMLAHPEMYPHFTVAGRSGGGKTRYGTKTKVAAALARGWYVATLGEMAPVGMHVFAGYPNYQDVVVDQPELVLAFMERLYEEIRLRMEALYQHKAGRWEEMLSYGPRVMVVVDEYAAIYDDLQGEYRTRYVRAVTNICRLARKAGIHLVLGVQNPTAESMRPSIRRNTLTQVFQVVDAVASQAIIQQAGAERLQGGQYLAVFQDGVHSGAAFDPSDDQLAAYLAERRSRITVYEQPGFLQQLPSGAEPALLNQANPELEKLRKFLEENPNASENAMCQYLWKQPNAGGYAAKIDALLLLLRGAGVSVADGR